MLGYRIYECAFIKGSNLIKGVNLEGLNIIGEPNEYALKYYESGLELVR